MMRILKLSVVVLVAALTMATLAQQRPASSEPAPQAATITVDARLVVVPVVVRDKKNVLVPGLGQENFALQVDGKTQVVRYFDHDADLPLTVGLLIDTSLSQRNVLDEERAASATFLDKMLAERDKAFLLEFARAATLLQDVTNSRPKLEEALKQVDFPRPEFQRGDSSNNSGTTGSDPDHEQRDRYRDMVAHAGTVMYDSVFLASDEIMARQQGRRALILLTDGDDHGSLKTLAKAIESAQRADTIVYAIYYKDDHGGYGGGHGGGFGGPGGGYGGHHGGMGGPGYGGQGGYEHVDGKKVLEQMCGETGGRMFEVTKKETVEKIYAEIGEELRSQYRLGFTPTADEASAGYHKVEVGLIGTPAKAKDQVQARDGYYKR